MRNPLKGEKTGFRGKSESAEGEDAEKENVDRNSAGRKIERSAMTERKGKGGEGDLADLRADISCAVVRSESVETGRKDENVKIFVTHGGENGKDETRLLMCEWKGVIEGKGSEVETGRLETVSSTEITGLGEDTVEVSAFSKDELSSCLVLGTKQGALIFVNQRGEVILQQRVVPHSAQNTSSMRGTSRASFLAIAFGQTQVDETGAQKCSLLVLTTKKQLLRCADFDLDLFKRCSGDLSKLGLLKQKMSVTVTNLTTLTATHELKGFAEVEGGLYLYGSTKVLAPTEHIESSTGVVWRLDTAISEGKFAIENVHRLDQGVLPQKAQVSLLRAKQLQRGVDVLLMLLDTNELLLFEVRYHNTDSPAFSLLDRWQAVSAVSDLYVEKEHAMFTMYSMSEKIFRQIQINLDPRKLNLSTRCIQSKMPLGDSQYHCCLLQPSVANIFFIARPLKSKEFIVCRLDVKGNKKASGELPLAINCLTDHPVPLCGNTKPKEASISLDVLQKISSKDLEQNAPKVVTTLREELVPSLASLSEVHAFYQWVLLQVVETCTHLKSPVDVWAVLEGVFSVVEIVQVERLPGCAHYQSRKTFQTPLEKIRAFLAQPKDSSTQAFQLSTIHNVQQLYKQLTTTKHLLQLWRSVGLLPPVLSVDMCTGSAEESDAALVRTSLKELSTKLLQCTETGQLVKIGKDVERLFPLHTTWFRKQVIKALIMCDTTDSDMGEELCGQLFALVDVWFPQDVQLLLLLLEESTTSLKVAAKKYVEQRMSKMRHAATTVTAEWHALQQQLDLLELELLAKDHGFSQSMFHNEECLNDFIQYLIETGVQELCQSEAPVTLKGNQTLASTFFLIERFNSLKRSDVLTGLLQALSLTSRSQVGERTLQACVLAVYEEELMLLPVESRIDVLHESRIFCESFFTSTTRIPIEWESSVLNVCAVGKIISHLLRNVDPSFYQSAAPTFQQTEDLILTHGYELASVSHEPQRVRESAFEAALLSEPDNDLGNFQQTVFRLGTLLGFSTDYLQCLVLKRVASTKAAHLSDMMHVVLSELLRQIDPSNGTGFVEVVASLAISHSQDKRLLDFAQSVLLKLVAMCDPMFLKGLTRLLSMISLLLLSLAHCDDTGCAGESDNPYEIVLQTPIPTLPFARATVLAIIKTTQALVPRWKERANVLQRDSLCPKVRKVVIAAGMMHMSLTERTASTLEKTLLEVTEYLQHNGARMLAMALLFCMEVQNIQHKSSLTQQVANVISRNSKELIAAHTSPCSTQLGSWLALVAVFGHKRALQRLSEALNANTSNVSQLFRLHCLGLEAARSIGLQYAKGHGISRRNKLSALRLVVDCCGDSQGVSAVNLVASMQDEEESSFILQRVVLTVLRHATNGKELGLEITQAYGISAAERIDFLFSFYFEHQKLQSAETIINVFDQVLRSAGDSLTTLTDEQRKSLVDRFNQVVARVGGCQYDLLSRCFKLLSLLSGDSNAYRTPLKLLDYLLLDSHLRQEDSRLIDFHRLSPQEPTISTLADMITPATIDTFVGLSPLLQISTDDMYAQLIRALISREQVIDKALEEQFFLYVQKMSSNNSRFAVCKLLLERFPTATGSRESVLDYALDVATALQSHATSPNEHLEATISFIKHECFMNSVLLKINDSLGDEIAGEVEPFVCKDRASFTAKPELILVELFERYIMEHPEPTHSLCEDIATCHGFDVETIKFVLADKWLSASFVKLEPADEIDEHHETLIVQKVSLLLRGATSQWDEELDQSNHRAQAMVVAKFLLRYILGTDSYRSKSRALNVLFQISEISVITDLVALSDHASDIESIQIRYQYFQYMVYFEKLGLSHSLKELMCCDKEGLVKALLRDSVPGKLVLELIVMLVVDFEIADPRVLQVISKHLQQLSLTHLIEKLNVDCGE